MKVDQFLILYAKHWYKETDLFQDLSKVLSEYYAYEMKKQDVAQILVSFVQKAIAAKERFFLEFVNDVHEENFWRVNRKTGNEEDYFYRVCCKCLSILCLLDVEDVKNIYGIKLERPDFSLLPPAREFSEELLSERFWE